MENIFNFEGVEDFYETLIHRIIDKLNIDESNYEITEIGDSLVSMYIRSCLDWCLAVANQVQGHPTEEEFLEETLTTIDEGGYSFSPEEAQQILDDIINKCSTEIKAWNSVLNSYFKAGTINQGMLDTIAEYYNINQ